MRNLLILCLSLACAAPSSVRKDTVASEGVVLPNGMCASRGEVAKSKDPPGNQMICELQDLVGSHVPKCVCRDEGQVDEDRDGAQQAMRTAAQHKDPVRGN